ncbi:hypothetical protein Pcinc_009238 [Petrolisthes cinctipes]|uniref:Uncharacterized protein n=1 Tax=Petrolisthes cinctipes TaxID=88211 RepID=A0AAE1G5R7_PETCI|nr:hypothetical protein Pcinc_009238 [Petrolisthes cinctipes]
MMLKAADPAWQLHVQGIDLAWTNSYQYLSVWVDKRLSFKAHAAYLRERTQARLNVMRARTRPTAGATFSVLRLYYVQAVRSLVDYSALVLALSPNQQERLESWWPSNRQEPTVMLHTDSRAGLQALQQPHPKDNVGLITTILGIL